MIVITGATGNTGSEISKALLSQGESVTVVGRSESKLHPLVTLGAKSAVGDLADASFLTHLFKQAKVAYLIVPPKWDVTDWRAYQRTVNQSFIKAIEDSGLQKVVVLSSQGSHRDDAGPVSGLKELEEGLSQIQGLDQVILRPGYFMQNLFGLMGMIQHMGIIGYALDANISVPFVHTHDIAKAAVPFLLDPNFKGIRKVFIAGAASYTMQQVSEKISEVLGKNIPYVRFSAEEAFQGMVQSGLPATIAHGYNELFACLNAGNYLSDFERTPENTTETTLETFLQTEFLPFYLQSIQKES